MTLNMNMYKTQEIGHLQKSLSIKKKISKCRKKDKYCIQIKNV